ncbi:hypothetical protein AB0L25_04620 [Spirillospora sp. NPDC052242]
MAAFAIAQPAPSAVPVLSGTKTRLSRWRVRPLPGAVRVRRATARLDLLDQRGELLVGHPHRALPVVVLGHGLAGGGVDERRVLPHPPALAAADAAGAGGRVLTP